LLGLACVAATGLMLGIAAARAARAPPGAGWSIGAWLALGLAFLPETVVQLAAGMETLLALFLNAALAAWMLRAIDREREIGVIGQLGGAMLVLLLALTRPEGAVLGLASVLCVLLARAEARDGFAAQLSRLRWVAIASVASIAALLAWHRIYFGVWMPNPYYVKAANRIFGTEGSSLPGAASSLRFAILRVIPMLALAWMLATFANARVALMARRWLAVPSLVVLVMLARVIHEMAGSFRYEYPLLAPLLLLVALAAAHLRNRTRGGFASVLAASGLCLPLILTPARSTFETWLRHPRSLPQGVLRSGAGSNALASLGVDLAATGLGQKATILLSGAGQVPYWSRFRAIDWVGLNDNYLSGREPRTLDDVWNYIGAQHPDLVYSILPPAASDGAIGGDDPNFRSALVQGFLAGRASELFQRWNHELVAGMFLREMRFVRENYRFGACYKLGANWKDDWWLFVYVRRDSPYCAEISKVLRESTRADRQSDLSRVFAFDPRKLGATP
jgi:hypothetical protein